MERLAFDILSFPEQTTQGNTCILVICDFFTKWVEAFALPDHKAVTVADILVTDRRAANPQKVLYLGS